MLDNSKNSYSLCNLPPIGPIPSIVGIPILDVKEPSDPPPVWACVILIPISWPTFFTIFNNTLFLLLSSTGNLFNPTVILILVFCLSVKEHIFEIYLLVYLLG